MQDNMSFILTYELKQETPIIHFQHNQSGATLRATEVKPKLDRFIIKKLGGAKNVNKDWFVKETEALNYKMQISAMGKPTISQTIDLAIKARKFPPSQSMTVDQKAEKRKIDDALKSEINEMYFGNMVKNSKNYDEDVRSTYKETVFFQSGIDLRIICLNKELIETIDRYIDEFFIVHNFGTRQSKGFGGFSVRRANGALQKTSIDVLIENGYKFFYTEIQGGNCDHKLMLNHAKNIYSVMKGGYNHTIWKEKEDRYMYPDRYIKGYIQRDFINDFYGLDVGSDKAYIKRHKRVLPSSSCSSKRKNAASDYENYIFVRALLGFADNYEFRDDCRKGRVDIFCLGEKDFDIDRFKSPITIKIIGNCLIFIFGSFDEICGKTFWFSPNGYDEEQLKEKNYTEKKKYIMNSGKFVKIITPEKFDKNDVVKFIENFVAYFDKEKEKLGKFAPAISQSSKIRLVVPNFKEV